jgi:glycine/D-amino acid oxidase-like deaminating enzyme
LLTEADVDLPLITEYHEVAILKNPMDMRGEGSACIDSILCVHFRSEGHDKTPLGTFTGKRGVDPDDFPQRASEESLAAMAEGACRCIPKLQNAEMVRGITGVYDLTTDCRPILGRFPKGAVCTLRLDFREWDSSFPRPSAWSWQSCCCGVGRKRWTSRRFGQAVRRGQSDSTAI